jgi:hypothetical protein
MMGMDEAYELARHLVDWYPEATICAIGRFKPAEQLQADDPWGVSVLAPGDARPRVLWSNNDFELLMSEQAANLRIQLVPVRQLGGSQFDEASVDQGLLF